MHKINVSIPNEVQSVNTVQVVQKHFSKVTLTEKNFDFYSDIRIFSGVFTAAKIRRQIRLAEFFSADIRRTKIRRLIRIFGGGLGV